MKLRQQQITRIEAILNSIEEKVKQIEEEAFDSYNYKEYINFNLEKDLRSLQAMLDDLREEINNE